MRGPHRQVILAAVVLATVACTDRGGSRSAPAEGGECAFDVDCVLLPTEVTCCGECPPSPPFEAATVAELDAILIESEQRCGSYTRPCPPPACAPVPRGCWAKAACDEGRCVVETDGCVPVSVRRRDDEGGSRGR